MATNLVEIQSRQHRSSNQTAHFRVQAPGARELESYRSQLRALPVTINGLADPAILRQSTEEKISCLIQDEHTGPVALVTKGDFSTSWWKPRLAEWSKQLDLHIFASISGLPRSYEPVATRHRFRTLAAAAQSGAKAICYLRPIVPGVNDSYENLSSIIQEAASNGAHAIVTSGFRGDETIVSESGFELATTEHTDWLPSVKLNQHMTEDTLRACAATAKIGLWTGTACAVAALNGDSHSMAPYHLATQFGGCSHCELKHTCADSALARGPRSGSLELLGFLGYHAKFVQAKKSPELCDVLQRSDCPQHCTNCTNAATRFGTPHIILERWDGTVPSWGDLCLARFLTGGMVCTHPQLSSKEESTITLSPRFGFSSNGAGSLYATTSWLMWSEYLPREQCFGCSYCFVGMYKDRLPAPMKGTVGASPVRILANV